MSYVRVVQKRKAFKIAVSDTHKDAHKNVTEFVFIIIIIIIVMFPILGCLVASKGGFPLDKK